MTTAAKRQTKIQKWGNSLAVRIPQPLAAQAHLGVGASVRMNAASGVLTIKLVDKPKPTLKSLVARMTKSNRAPAVDDGGPVGKEVL